MLLPKQIWKDIPDYEGKYQVSNTGKVRSLNYRCTGKVKILKQNTDKLGYKRVFLYKNGKFKIYFVHRLVALVFIPNPNNYPIVNHKDENPSNNTVWNLEWCTQEYNCNYGTRLERCSKGLKGKNKGKHHTKETKRKIGEGFKGKNNPKAKPILMFTLEGEFIRRFECVADANEYLGKPRNIDNLSNCARGKTKTAYDYIWKYEEDC